jgi:putative ABC transport system permease protein
MAAWALDGLLAIAPSGAPRVNEIGLSTAVFGFAAALVLVAGLGAGAGPAVQLSRRDVARGLGSGARAGAPAGSLTLRRTLVVAEVGLALVLLAGGGLLLRTFVSLQAADLGFDPRNVLVAGINPPGVKYDTDARRRAYYDQALEKAAALPGVRRAALASVLPLGGDTDTDLIVEGAPPHARSDAPATWYRSVSAAYFEAMGIRIVRGRAFTDGEPARSAIVNETFARRHFSGQDPLGRRIRLGGPDEEPFTIVGIAADVKARGARRDALVETYVPYWHLPERGMNLVLKTAGDPAGLAPALKHAVSSIDPAVPLFTLATLEEIVGDSIEVPRFTATVATLFAALALILAAVGLYGVMAYAVTERTQEIGVRLALGATAPGIFRLVALDGLRITALGIVLGLAGSIGVARVLDTLLFEVRPADPLTLAGTAAALLAVAAAACIVPAWRAARVDPVVALRSE